MAWCLGEPLLVRRVERDVEEWARDTPAPVVVTQDGNCRLGRELLDEKALAPSAGALVIEYSGAVATVATLTGFAIANVVLVGILWATCRPPRNAAVS